MKVASQRKGVLTGSPLAGAEAEVSKEVEGGPEEEDSWVVFLVPNPEWVLLFEAVLPR
jgi:hypothetical protein